VPKIFDFDAKDSGIPINEKLPVDAAPVEYFNKIWETSIIHRIALESNIYIFQVHDNQNFSKKMF
jgi:hypothetical protein